MLELGSDRGLTDFSDFNSEEYEFTGKATKHALSLSDEEALAKHKKLFEGDV